MEVENFGNYKNKKLGIGLTYSSKLERLSIFKYDYDYKKIDDDILREFTISALADIKEFTKRRGEKTYVSRGLGTIQFTGFPIHNFIHHVFKQGKPKFEFLGMGHDGRCITKIRYTLSEDYDWENATKLYVKYLRLLEKYVGENEFSYQNSFVRMVIDMT